MSIRTRLIEYADGDAVFEGLLAWEDAIDAPLPGVMISHAWGGRGKFDDDKAQALARLGYAAFALDLYGKGVIGKDKDENAALMQPFLDDRAMLQRRMLLSLDTFRDQAEVDSTRVAALGFCFGGLCVLDLARTGEALAGVVSFHGLLGPPGNTGAKPISAKVLVLHGWDDPLAPPNQVLALGEELSAQDADWQLHAYGNTMHAFMNPVANDPGFGTVYSPQAERRAWCAMLNFLAEVIGVGSKS